MKLALSFLSGLAWTAALLTLIGWMNLAVDQREEDTVSTVNFSVPAVAPKRTPPPPSSPPPSRARRTDSPSLAPAPGVGSGLSSLSIDVPDYASADLDSEGQGLLGQVEDVAMTSETVDKPPVVRQGGLTYPERAKQRGQEGQVTVSLLIGTDGKVEKFKILESVPAGVFDQAVTESVPRWTFAPAEYQGRPVSVWVSLPLEFKLK